jgi:hypothetical protein
MFPPNGSHLTGAERTFYKWCEEGLGDDFAVFANVWSRDRGKEEEADFVVAHPRYGFVAIEVKGGWIDSGPEGLRQKNRRTGHWERIDPLKQARNAAFSLQRKFLKDEQWKRSEQDRWIATTYVVAFPDQPRIAARECFIYQDDKDQVEKILLDILRGGIERRPRAMKEFGQQGIDTLIRLEHYSVLSVGRRLPAEEQRYLRLTEEQTKVLNTIRRSTRAHVRGTAGTGKTLLASYEANRLGKEGEQVLFVVHSPDLARFLAERVEPEAAGRVKVCTFLDLVGELVEEAGGRGVEVSLSLWPEKDRDLVHGVGRGTGQAGAGDDRGPECLGYLQGRPGDPRWGVLPPLFHWADVVERKTGLVAQESAIHLGTDPYLPPGARLGAWGSQHQMYAFLGRRLELCAQALTERRFDAVIMDEGQNFPHAWIAALQQLLRDPDRGRCWVFADPEQALIPELMPLADDPGWAHLDLPTACRSGTEICEWVRKYARGAGAEAAEGLPPGDVTLGTIAVQEQAAAMWAPNEVVKERFRRLREFVVFLLALGPALSRLLGKQLDMEGEQVPPHAIAVVPIWSGVTLAQIGFLYAAEMADQGRLDVGDVLQRFVRRAVADFCNERGLEFAVDPNHSGNSLLVCPVERLQGLERAVVITVVWPANLDAGHGGAEPPVVHFSPRQERELYCALSRAQNRVIIVGGEAGIACVQRGPREGLGREYVSAARVWPEVATLPAICQRGLELGADADAARELHFWAARGHHALGNRTEAVEELRTCLGRTELNRLSPEKALLEGMEHAARRRWEAAAECCRRLLGPGFLDPGSDISTWSEEERFRRFAVSMASEQGVTPAAQFLLGACLAEQGDQEGACREIAAAGLAWIAQQKPFPDRQYYETPEVRAGYGDWAMSTVREVTWEQAEEYYRTLVDPELDHAMVEAGFLPVLWGVEPHAPDYHERHFGRARQCLRAIWEIDPTSPHLREVEDALMLARVVSHLRGDTVTEEQVDAAFAESGWWGVATLLLTTAQDDALDCLEVGEPHTDRERKIHLWRPLPPPRWLREWRGAGLPASVREDLETFSLEERMNHFLVEVESAAEPPDDRTRFADLRPLQRTRHILQLAGIHREELDRFPAEP